MPKSLFIFNFKRMPGGFIVFLALALLLEIFIFPKAYVLTNRSTIGFVYKSMLIKNHHSADIIILGRSRAEAIDANKFETALKHELRVYNYAVANLWTPLHLYLELKKYLSSCNAPKLIIASQPPEAFMNGVDNNDGDGLPNPNSEKANVFCRFISITSLLFDVPYRGKYALLPKYADLMIPSYNYRYFIKKGFLDSNFYIRNHIDNGKKVLNHMRLTNGQLLYEGAQEVAETDLAKHISSRAMIDFERFVELANKNGIRTVFIFMPIRRDRYNRMIELGVFDAIEEQMRRLESKYSSFKYYKIKDLGYDERYFAGWSHLNKEGADIFTGKLIEYYLADMR